MFLFRVLVCILTPISESERGLYWIARGGGLVAGRGVRQLAAGVQL